MARQGTRLKWTEEMRLALHLMHTEFDLDRNAKDEVFKVVFETTRLGETTLSAQYNEHRYGYRSHLWQRVLSPPQTGPEMIRRTALKAKIASIAKSLGYKDAVQRSEEVEHHRSLPGLQSYNAYLYDNGQWLEDHRLDPQGPSDASSSKVSQTTVKGVRNLVTAVGHDDNDDEIDNPTRKHGRRGSPTIAQTPKKRGRPRKYPVTSPTTERTPQSSTARRRPDATVNFQNTPSGGSIWLTPKQYEETQGNLRPVPAELAHPPVALLLRYWDDNCQSKLTDDGFIAGRYAETFIPPPTPPTLDDFLWSDAHLHLDRKKVASPFISTSNHFTWIVRLAVKQFQLDSSSNGRITLIDASKINRSAVFAAQPFHHELCRKRCFDNAAFMYHGMHEFLVYAKIPSRAIISTISTKDLIDLASNHQGVGTLVRLNELGAVGKGYATTILPAFKAQKLALTSDTIKAIARLIKFFGLRTTTPVQQLSHAVSDIVQGWGLSLAYSSPESWQKTAEIFASAMFESRSSGLPSIRELNNVSYAWLDGVRWGCGDFNARHSPRKAKTMIYRATKNLGIESAADLLTSNLFACEKASVQLGLSAASQQRQIQNASLNDEVLAQSDVEEWVY